MNVLTVDLKASNAKQQFVKSLHETGFAVLRNHPIKRELIDEVYARWKEFFADDSKNDYHYSEDTQDGFFPKSVSETAKGYDLKDIKEFYHYYPWGKKPESTAEASQALFDQMQALAATLLKWIEEETPEEIRSQFSMPLPDMITDCPTTMLRILHYPPFNGDEQEGAVRAAAHGDINLLTLLPAATDSGLQVQSKSGEWVDVPCDYGSIAVNIGDMLEMCSKHFYPSTIHRVVNPEGEAAQRSRLSLPLFLHARPEVQLSEQYTADDFLKERLRELGVLS